MRAVVAFLVALSTTGCSWLGLFALGLAPSRPRPPPPWRTVAFPALAVAANVPEDTRIRPTRLADDVTILSAGCQVHMSRTRDPAYPPGEHDGIATVGGQARYVIARDIWTPAGTVHCRGAELSGDRVSCVRRICGSVHP